jgi:(4S)-4-hydroxy-5-phosphonooxypentane-2,3-dione isomerase
MSGILFRVKVKPANRQVFIEFIEWDARVAREQERASGTLWLDYYEDPKNANAFFVYEAYRDDAAFDAHKQNDPYKRWDRILNRTF